LDKPLLDASLSKDYQEGMVESAVVPVHGGENGFFSQEEGV
jgi:hypothetical protein